MKSKITAITRWILNPFWLATAVDQLCALLNFEIILKLWGKFYSGSDHIRLWLARKRTSSACLKVKSCCAIYICMYSYKRYFFRFVISAVCILSISPCDRMLTFFRKHFLQSIYSSCPFHKTASSLQKERRTLQAYCRYISTQNHPLHFSHSGAGGPSRSDTAPLLIILTGSQAPQ